MVTTLRICNALQRLSFVPARSCLHKDRGLSSIFLQQWKFGVTFHGNNARVHTVAEPSQTLATEEGNRELSGRLARSAPTQPHLGNSYAARSVSVERSSDQLNDLSSLRTNPVPAAFIARQEEQREEMRKTLLNGRKTNLRLAASPTSREGDKHLSVKTISFFIPADVDLVVGEVDVKCDISDSPHPHRIAQNALPSDPAYRLGIKVTGLSSKGTKTVYWCKSIGTKTLFRLNTLCDFLEGVPIETTETTPRRAVRFRNKNTQDRTKVFYTSDPGPDRRLGGKSTRRNEKEVVCQMSRTPLGDQTETPET